MKLKKNIALSESGFLFDPSTGESFNLNKTGKLILKQLSEGKSEIQIMEFVMKEYDVETHTYHRYFDDFMQTLSQFNLIEKEDV